MGRNPLEVLSYTTGVNEIAENKQKFVEIRAGFRSGLRKDVKANLVVCYVMIVNVM